MTGGSFKLESKVTMDCTVFQERLPEIIEAGRDPTAEEHLKHCETCAALVRDLMYIAEQARLLLPAREPGPEVWRHIRSAIERDGHKERQEGVGGLQGAEEA